MDLRSSNFKHFQPGGIYAHIDVDDARRQMSWLKLMERRSIQFRKRYVLNPIIMSRNKSFHTLPSDTPIEEETIPGYDPQKFYPVNPGDLFNNRYKTIAKVGWGRTSTVWLAQDTRRYITLFSYLHVH